MTYRYRERERERDTDNYLHMYTYLTSLESGHLIHENSEGLSSTAIPKPRESHPVPAQALPNL